MPATNEDLARLLVSIEFTQKQSEKQLAAIAKRAGQSATDIETRFKKANDNTASSFVSSGKKVEASLGAQRAAVQNLSFQLNDIATSLSGGASPFQVMMQQGSQVAQALSSTGGGLGGVVRTLGGAFASMVNPVSLASFALIGLTGAAVQYFTNLDSNSKDAETVLKGHADLIRRIKDAYGEAAQGLEDYSTESKKILAEDTAKNIKQLQDSLQTAAKSLSGEFLSIPASTFEGATYTIQEVQAAIYALNESAKDGQPDVRGFLERLIDIKNQSGTPKAIRELIDSVVTTGKESVDVQGKLEGLQKFINGVGEAAGSQTRQINEFAKSIDKLADIALPQLSDMEQAAKAYTDALKVARTEADVTLANDAFRAAQQRIRDQNPTIVNGDGRNVSVPTPESRPLVELEGLGESAKKVKDTFDGLDGTVDRYVDQIVKAESGGKSNAKNPNSSATGLGQFIESTWLSLFKQHFPDRAKSMSDATILALRNDADISRELIKEYARQNAEILRQAGVSVNEAALHLAHFLGPQGAIAVLQAKSGTLASSVLSQGAVAANQSILGNGATVDDVIKYAESRAGAYDKMRTAANALKVEQKELNNATKEFAQFGTEIVGGFINDLRNGASAAEALRNALNRVLDKVIEISLQGLFGGGAGSALGKGGLLGGFLIPGILHSGGVAGADGYGHGRSVSPSTFAGAKRYHTGGVAGLQPGEVPAILQRGEVVLPRGTKMTAGQQGVHVTVGVSADNNGNLMPFVESVSQRTVAAASPRIVSAANRSAPTAMANYQNNTAGRDYRNG
ncbi:UNVERIFIED_ORG: hypothetical protein GGI57_004077 [Rhizobium aethiopicum]